LSKKDEKDAIIYRMIQLLEDRISNSCEDYLDESTNLAWLYIHINKIKEARKITQSVLEIDKNHIHALKLIQKIGSKKNKSNGRI